MSSHSAGIQRSLVDDAGVARERDVPRDFALEPEVHAQRLPRARLEEHGRRHAAERRGRDRRRDVARAARERLGLDAALPGPHAEPRRAEHLRDVRVRALAQVGVVPQGRTEAREIERRDVDAPGDEGDDVRNADGEGVRLALQGSGRVERGHGAAHGDGLGQPERDVAALDAGDDVAPSRLDDQVLRRQPFQDREARGAARAVAAEAAHGAVGVAVVGRDAAGPVREDEEDAVGPDARARGGRGAGSRRSPPRPRSRSRPRRESRSPRRSSS